jgi:cytidylate kinase
MAQQHFVVTIDGPAASGKSSVSRELAKRLACPWVSTGAFYRGLAYVALQEKVALDDVQSVVSLASSSAWSVQVSPERTHVVYLQTDVTDAISAEQVGNCASVISKYPEVRSALLAQQRQFAQRTNGLVAEGRDCGTVVFPQAQAKVFLTASSERRAERRAQEQGIELSEIQAAQRDRDTQDSTRKTAPLQAAQDAYLLDSTEMSLDEAVDHIEKFVRSRI